MAITNEIEGLTETEFARLFSKLHSRMLEDPIKNFIEPEHLLGFTPTLAQRVVLKTVFHVPLNHDTAMVRIERAGTEGEFLLVESEQSEISLYEEMTGIPYDPGAVDINQVNLVIGRRAGKSTMSVIIALLIALKINWKPYLRKTPVATVAILSHSVDLSKDILDIFKEFVDNSPLLTRLMSKKRKNTQNEFNLAIPFFVDKKGKETLIYSEVSFKVGAASKKTTRGRAVCAALCDEIAYWNLDEKAAESDADVLRALRPSLGQFKEHGMLLKLSSPAIKQGVLYDEWERRIELKDQIVQFKAPSWVCNNIVDFDFYQKEWRLDENNFDTEYRANFVESISSFIPPEHVDECVASGITIIPPFEKNRHSVYSAAIDAAFKSDRFAFTIVANHEGQLTQHSALLWENSKQNPSSAFEIAETISNVCEQYGISRVYADQFAFQPLKEIFERHNISLQENTFTLAYKKKIYYALRQVIKDKKIRLLDSQIQTRELKELEVSQSPTGHIKIGHPRGGSDDAADALATATFMALQKGQSFKMTSTAQVDVKAGAFETLKRQNDLEIFDNTGLYRQNPETKEWEVRPDPEDDNFTFNF